MNNSVHHLFLFVQMMIEKRCVLSASWGTRAQCTACATPPRETCWHPLHATRVYACGSPAFRLAAIIGILQRQGGSKWLVCSTASCMTKPCHLEPPSLKFLSLLWSFRENRLCSKRIQAAYGRYALHAMEGINTMGKHESERERKSERGDE